MFSGSHPHCYMHFFLLFFCLEVRDCQNVHCTFARNQKSYTDMANFLLLDYEETMYDVSYCRAHHFNIDLTSEFDGATAHEGLRPTSQLIASDSYMS